MAEQLTLFQFFRASEGTCYVCVCVSVCVSGCVEDYSHKVYGIFICYNENTVAVKFLRFPS